MKEIKITAYLCNGEQKVKGTLSCEDGFFKTDNPKDNVFSFGGTIEFKYSETEYSFRYQNIGGKYFIRNHRNNLEYQKILSFITLNEELATKDSKPSVARRKI